MYGTGIGTNQFGSMQSIHGWTVTVGTGNVWLQVVECSLKGGVQRSDKFFGKKNNYPCRQLDYLK